MGASPNSAEMLAGPYGAGWQNVAKAFTIRNKEEI